MKHTAAAALATAIVATTLVIVPAQSSSADSQFTVSWTHIGIYPRTEPTMNAPHAGPAVADDTIVTVQCEATGQSVTSDVGTSNIWERTTIGWLPNVFVETGANGFTPGVPRCDQSTAPDSGTAPQMPPAANPESPAPAAEAATTVEGVPLPTLGLPVPAALLNWYQSGLGGSVVVDWNFYAADPSFIEWARQQPRDGVERTYAADPRVDGEVYWASGAFAVRRDSEHCFRIRDDYDFDPTKVSNWPFFGLYLEKHMNHAADFTVVSSGCAF